MLKVMIVDNESAIRKGLVHCIHWGDLGCEIAAQADDGMMALEQIPAGCAAQQTALACRRYDADSCFH